MVYATHKATSRLFHSFLFALIYGLSLVISPFLSFQERGDHQRLNVHVHDFNVLDLRNISCYLVSYYFFVKRNMHELRFRYAISASHIEKI